MGKKPKRRRLPRHVKKAEVISFRITPFTKKLLELSAKWEGRTLSAEVENQLQFALIHCLPSNWVGTELKATARELAAHMRKRGEGGGEWPHPTWWNDNRNWAQRDFVLAYAKRINTEPEPTCDPDAILDQLHAFPADQYWNKRLNNWGRWIAMLKGAFGGLVGKTDVLGERLEVSAAVRTTFNDLAREYITLKHKSDFGYRELTEQEQARLLELSEKIAKLQETPRLRELYDKIDKLKDEELEAQ